MDGAQVSDGSTPSLSAFANATEFRNIVLGAATSPTEAGLLPENTRRPHCGEKPFLNCGYSACNHGIQIDLAALAMRLGRDHGAMHRPGAVVPLSAMRRGRPRPGPSASPISLTTKASNNRRIIAPGRANPVPVRGRLFFGHGADTKRGEERETSLLLLTICSVGFFGGCAQDRTVDPLIKSHGRNALRLSGTADRDCQQQLLSSVSTPCRSLPVLVRTPITVAISLPTHSK